MAKAKARQRGKRKTLDCEKQTLLAMLTIYCRAHHGARGEPLCGECRQLHEYAEQRLEKCPFGPDKGPCSHCEVHCYKPDMRHRIRDVMRYAGPKMVTKHPVLALRHLIKERRHIPPQRKGR